MVFTHRDPVDVIRSAATMLTYGQRMQRKQIDPKAMVNYWADRIEWMLRRSIESRQVFDEKQCHDVYFKNFMADDLGTIEQIYATHGIELTDDVRKKMNDFINNHQRGKHGRVRYDLEDQFGVRREEIAERFDFYYQQFSV